MLLVTALLLCAYILQFLSSILLGRSTTYQKRNNQNHRFLLTELSYRSMFCNYCVHSIISGFSLDYRIHPDRVQVSLLNLIDTDSDFCFLRLLCLNHLILLASLLIVLFFCIYILYFVARSFNNACISAIFIVVEQ